MNWNDFEEKCYKITVRLMNEILSEQPEESFYAFCLYTDSSAMTVSLSANSEEKLKAILCADSDDSREMQNYYRWATSEWAYEGYGADFFSEISKELRLSEDRVDLEGFKRNLIDSLVNVLIRAKKEMFINEDIVIPMFVSVTDDDDAEYIENSSSKEINSKAVHDFFLNRYEN